LADLSLSKLPWTAQLAVFAALVAAGAGAFDYFYDVPARKRLAARQVELDGISTKIEKGRAAARRLDEFRSEVADLQAQLERLKPILPDEKDAADLLRRVNSLALQSNLSILGFKPEAITTRQIHAEWPIALELEGTYHNLGLFLDRVSKLPRIINVGALEIKAKPQPAPGSTIEVTCTATTFVLLDAPAPAPAKKGAPAPAKSE
jgi:type IV pilus assembly protein PilO